MQDLAIQIEEDAKKVIPEVLQTFSPILNNIKYASLLKGQQFYISLNPQKLINMDKEFRGSTIGQITNDQYRQAVICELGLNGTIDNRAQHSLLTELRKELIDLDYTADVASIARNLSETFEYVSLYTSQPIMAQQCTKSLFFTFYFVYNF